MGEDCLVLLDCDWSEDSFNLIERPVEVRFLDDEGWGEADDGVVGLFAEDAAGFECFAVGAGRGVEFEGEPESAAAYLLEDGAMHRLETGEGVGAEIGRALGEVFVDDDAEGGTGYGAGEGVSAEGAAVIAWMEDAKDGA